MNMNSNIIFKIKLISNCRKVILQQTNKYPISILEISFLILYFQMVLKKQNLIKVMIYFH